MRKVIAGATRIIAVLFAIVFIVTATLAILIVNIKPHLLNAATYINALASENVYTRLPRIITDQVITLINYDPCQVDPLICTGATPEFTNCARTALGEMRFEALLASPTQLSAIEKLNLQTCLVRYGSTLQSQTLGNKPAGELTPFLQAFGVNNLETMLSQLIPPDELQGLVENTITQVFAYLNGEQETAAISLVSLKQSISSPVGVSILIGTIRAQAPCSLQQMEQMTTSILSDQPVLMLCKPSDALLNMLTGVIKDMLGTFVNQIPNQIVILSPTTGENQGQPGSGLIGYIQVLKLILRFAPVPALVFLLLISILAIRSAKNLLRWWGIPFFITGTFAFSLAATVSLFFEQAWQNLLVIHLPPYLDASVIALAHDLLRAILQPYLGGVYLVAAPIGLAGLGMWIGSHFIN